MILRYFLSSKFFWMTLATTYVPTLSPTATKPYRYLLYLPYPH